MAPGIIPTADTPTGRRVPPGTSSNYVRQKPEEAGTLDRLPEFTLLLRRNRGDPARHDLAALRYVALQEFHVLVIDLGRVGARERAGLAPAEEGAASAALLEAHGVTSSAAMGSMTRSSPSPPSSMRIVRKRSTSSLMRICRSISVTAAGGASIPI